MKRTTENYKENPYLVLFDTAYELGIFEFFEKKTQEGKKDFFPLDKIYKGCRNIPDEYKGGKCPNQEKCPFRDHATKKTPCKDFFKKNYPFILCPFKENSKQTFYFLLICLSSEMEFFEKKGRHFRKKYRGSAAGSTEYKILESGVYNHIFDLKNFLDISNSHAFFCQIKDRLIREPHPKKNRPPLSDKLFFKGDARFTYLKGLAKIAYDQLPEFLSVTDFIKCKTILDIGPGPCVYSMGIYNKLLGLHPGKKEGSEGIRIFGLDSRAVEDWHSTEDYRKFVVDKLKPLNFADLEERFTFVPISPGSKAGENKKDGLFSDKTWNQDLLKNRKFDAILVQNVVSHNSKRHVKRLIEKCYESLNFGGKIKIQDYVKDISESQPFAAVVSALYFRSISNAGQTYTNFEISHMLFECGFRNIRQLKGSRFSSIFEAEKNLPIEKNHVLLRFWRYMFIMNHSKKKQEDKGQSLDFESIYSIDIISLFKKAIFEYKKDIQEFIDDEKNPKRKNYIREFDKDISQIQEKFSFDKVIQDIDHEIDKCINELRKCIEKQNKHDMNNDCEPGGLESLWKLLFHLSLLDKEVISQYPHDRNARKIKKQIYSRIYSKKEKFIIKIIENSKCPPHLKIFFLLMIFKEFPKVKTGEVKDVVKDIADLEEPYFVARDLQKYFGPDQEACKYNLLHCIVESDKIDEPVGFIYLWTLRWFLEYDILDKDEFEYQRLVEEFSQSRFPFIVQQVEEIKDVLEGKADLTPTPAEERV